MHALVKVPLQRSLVKTSAAGGELDPDQVAELDGILDAFGWTAESFNDDVEALRQVERLEKRLKNPRLDELVARGKVAGDNWTAARVAEVEARRQQQMAQHALHMHARQCGGPTQLRAKNPRLFAPIGSVLATPAGRRPSCLGPADTLVERVNGERVLS